MKDTRQIDSNQLKFSPTSRDLQDLLKAQCKDAALQLGGSKKSVGSAVSRIHAKVLRDIFVAARRRAR
jgi:hypothetical protein